MASHTADDLYRKALKRRDELLIEMEALTQFIESYRRLLNLRSSNVHELPDEPNLFGRMPPRAARAEKIAEMVDAARKIIISEKRPMKRGELRERVEALGFEVIGADKNKVFGTTLWRSRKFRMLEGQGYWPLDAELPSESSK